MPENDKDLTNLFRSTEELAEPEEAVEIFGEIPKWINGTFYRTGPGKFELDNFVMNHWLDGYACLSKFVINGEKSSVKIHKKFLKSDALQKASAAGKPIYTEFSTKGAGDPNKNIFSRLVSSVFPIDLTDNDCVSIFQIGPDLFSTTDTCFMRRITDDLETCEKYDTNKCFGLAGTSAHPIREEDGTVFNIGFSCMTGLKFNILKIPGKGCTSKEVMKRSKIIASINSRWSTGLAYNHSFGLTQNYIIFIEQPYVVSFSKIASSVIKGGAAFKDWLEWREDELNRFVIVEKTGKIFKTEFFSNESFFFLHFINCYEENNQIVVDVNVYKSPAFLDKMYLKNLRNNIIEEVDPPCAQRFVLPLVDLKQVEEGVNLININTKTTATAIRLGNVITVQPEILTERGLELPAINKAFMGKKNKYFYATGTVCENSFVNSICKVNLDTKETQFWRHSNYIYPGEPIFIKNPHGDCDDESDGVVISAVTDVRSDHKDFLVFIDAKSWCEIGRAHFTAHVPQALHGIFLDDSIPVIP